MGCRETTRTPRLVRLAEARRRISYDFSIMGGYRRDFLERYTWPRWMAIYALTLWPVMGYSMFTELRQQRDEWTGTLLRVYEGDSPLTFITGGSFGKRRRYWEVRISTGEVISIRIFDWTGPDPLSGHAVYKQRGFTDPSRDLRRWPLAPG